MIHQSVAILSVSDVAASAKFYTEVLGFRVNWLWGTPPTFGAIGFAGGEFFLCQNREVAGRAAGQQHFFRVEDLEGLYEKQKTAGAEIASPPEDKPWGLREYTVRDPDGYVLRFAGAVNYERPVGATGVLPEYVRVERRVANVGEYSELLRSVGWHVDGETVAGALAKSVVGIVAVDGRDGRAVGLVRATGDGRYFMIWDVVVRPDFQGRKIGTAMVEAAVEELRKVGKPGSFVGLFTGKGKFYERVGFRPIEGMTITL